MEPETLYPELFTITKKVRRSENEELLKEYRRLAKIRNEGKPWIERFNDYPYNAIIVNCWTITLWDF